MRSSSKLILLMYGTLFTAGCSVPMTSLYYIDDSQFIDRALSSEQVKESILEGASYVGWVTQDLGNNSILATYRIRNHSVTVKISYTQKAFIALYNSSDLMKMACTDWEYHNGKYRVSGENNCPGNQAPKYIHVNYKSWVESLVASIDRSLETR